MGSFDKNMMEYEPMSITEVIHVIPMSEIQILPENHPTYTPCFGLLFRCHLQRKHGNQVSNMAVSLWVWDCLHSIECLCLVHIGIPLVYYVNIMVQKYVCLFVTAINTTSKTTLHLI